MIRINVSALFRPSLSVAYLPAFSRPHPQFTQRLMNQRPLAMLQRPIQFVFDFDGTFTKKDTLHLVAEAGYKRQDDNVKQKQPPPWQEIVDAYTSDYEAHTNSYQPEESRRTSITSEAEWLDSLEAVEKASANRVNDAGIFLHVTKEDMETATKHALKTGKVELRPGWAQLLVSIHKLNSTVSSGSTRYDMIQLISVNWSRWFIWSIVWHAATLLKDKQMGEQVKEALSEAAIYANEIGSVVADELDIESMSIPDPEGRPISIRTAGDKLKHMQLEASKSDTKPEPLRVYVGDSATDLECLVMADVGICMRDREMGSSQKDLASICDRLGIQVKPLDEYQEVKRSATTLEQLEESMSKTPIAIYQAHDLHEVTQWLERITSTKT